MNTFIQILIKLLSEGYKFIIDLYTIAEIKIIAIAGALGMMFAKAVGGFDTQIQMLLLFIAIDYCSGMYAAFKNEQINSYRSFKGIIKKATIIGVVAFCYWSDLLFSTNTIRYFAICGYGVMELVSIIENADRGGWGYIFPSFIREKLAQIKTEKMEVRK